MSWAAEFARIVQRFPYGWTELDAVKAVLDEVSERCSDFLGDPGITGASAFEVIGAVSKVKQDIAATKAKLMFVELEVARANAVPRINAEAKFREYENPEGFFENAIDTIGSWFGGETDDDRGEDGLRQLRRDLAEVDADSRSFDETTLSSDSAVPGHIDTPSPDLGDFPPAPDPDAFDGLGFVPPSLDPNGGGLGGGAGGGLAVDSAVGGALAPGGALGPGALLGAAGGAGAVTGASGLGGPGGLGAGLGQGGVGGGGGAFMGGGGMAAGEDESEGPRGPGYIAPTVDEDEEAGPRSEATAAGSRGAAPARDPEG